MRWSNYLTKLLLASGMLIASHMIYAQDTLEIFDMEYFFDVDPGFGSATAITITPSDSIVTLTELLSTSGLTTGFHTLGVRARNVPFSPEYNVLDTGSQIIEPYLYIDPALRSAGQWGMTETRLVFVDQSDAGTIVNVDQIEYFFDVDPGVGSASQVTAFTAGNSITIAESLNSDTLSFGFHLLGMRARAVGGAWGTTETRLIFVDKSDAGGIINVDQIEYFFDADPGVGSASQVTSFTATNSVSIVESLNTDTLSFGFHTLGMRARSEGGAWGTTETRLIFVDKTQGVVNVDQIEYFFDADPGVGAATLLPSFTAANSVTLMDSLNSSGLSVGFHVLGMRARAEGGSWGTTETRLVYVDQSQLLSNIIELEYFFRNDPGVGNATNIVVGTPGLSIMEEIVLSTDTLALGSNTVNVRAKNQDGNWGLTESRAIEIVNVGPPILSSTQSSPTNLAAIDLTVTFEEAVGSFDETDIEVSAGGAVQPLSFTTVNDSTYTLTLDLSIEGTITVDIADSAAFAIDDSSPTPPAETFEIVFDITPPVVTVDSLTTSDPSPALSGTVDNDSTAIEITVNGETVVASSVSGGIWNLNAGVLTPLANGIYDVIVTATDSAGNIGVDVSVNELTVSYPVPSAPIISSIESLPTNSASIGIDIDFGEAVFAFDETDISVSAGGAIQPLSFTTIDDSTYSAIIDLSVEGNINVSIPDSAAFTIADTLATLASTNFVIQYDVTDPIVTVDDLSTPLSSPPLSGTVSEDTTAVSITVDGSTYPATSVVGGIWLLSAGVITPPLQNGIYDIMVTAVDSAGNVGMDATTNELIVGGGSFEAFPATGVTSTSFIASWSPAADLLNYELDVSTASDFSSFVSGYDSLVTNSNIVTVSDLDFSTNYYYRVRVRNTSSVLEANSNVIALKTGVDSVTISDSTALVQMYTALDGPNWSTPVNWETARLRDWDGVTLDGTKTRVDQVDINGQGASGQMPNPFTGDAVGGLGAMTLMNLHNNQIQSLMDFSGTAISDLDVSTNELEFDDLEPLVGIATLTYAPQADLFFDEDTGGDPIKHPHLSDTSLTVTTGGSTNTYTFFRNANAIAQGAGFNIVDSTFTIVAIDFDNMGEFNGEVTNAQLPDLTLQVLPQTVLAIADLSMTITDESDVLLTDPVSGYLLEAVRRQQGFDTLELVVDAASTFTFPDVVLGDYLCGIDPSNKDLFIPTYFGDAFEWTFADTLLFREAVTVQVIMTSVPGATEGPGVLDVLIEEDFPEPGSRIDARRRAAKRKCGLRRKRSGGRTGQDDDEFELIAYGETDENGEFKFGFLPEGTYRFFVEYPGIPLDESSTVEFIVGEEGISDTEFKLEAFVDEDGIEVTIDRVLGLILTYFKDLEVYPNPASELVRVKYRHLKSSSVSAQLVDLTGNTYWTTKFENGFDGEKEIDISDFSEGIYLLHIFDETDRNGSVVTYRIIVKR
ncbi:Ig-like domain-containing protein [Ekhidna sp.]|uniref:Ig-like domain-containing protein n=1 Tax=Ekhidna sp. TaxID=2608089 RepID=UPI003BABFB6C